MKIRLIFLIVHLFIIIAMVVLLAFGAYSDEAGNTRLRRLALQELYSEIELYKQDNGKFPESLDSLLRCDEQTGMTYFGSKALGTFPPFSKPDEIRKYGINKIIRYQLINQEPVISDLGGDAKEGGLGRNMDVVYPEKHQKPFEFREFVKTELFRLSLVVGLILASGMSLCLYGIWKKGVSSKSISLPAGIVLSILFLLFELFLANAILFAHIYPHH